MPIAFVLALALLAGPADAASGGAAAEASAIAAGVDASLAGEVARRSAEHGADPWTLLAPLVAAARAGAAQEPVASKVLEGLAKRVPADRVVAVALRLAERLAADAARSPPSAPAGAAAEARPPPPPWPAPPAARSH